jgi:predicted nucleic acid-binding protein
VILVDSSVWIDHLHRTDTRLVGLLDDVRVCTHPMVIEELALGTLRRRRHVLDSLGSLPWAPVATHDEVLAFVDAHRLFGLGLSLVDAHLVAAARLSETTQVWTRDRSLRSTANRLGVAAGLS